MTRARDRRESLSLGGPRERGRRIALGPFSKQGRSSGGVHPIERLYRPHLTQLGRRELVRRNLRQQALDPLRRLGRRTRLLSLLQERLGLNRQVPQFALGLLPCREPRRVQ